MKSLIAMTGLVILTAVAGEAFQVTPPPVNADAKTLADFSNRVTEYVKLHKKANGAVHPQKQTTSQAAIVHHQHELAEEIQKLRKDAKPGDIFTTEAAEVFRRLITQAMKGSSGTKVNQSLNRAEPVKVQLRVNRAYPEGLPVQSMPPTLLANLPPLPKEMDYRLTGQNLILRDVEANLIIDFVLNAIAQ